MRSPVAVPDLPLLVREQHDATQACTTLSMHAHPTLPYHPCFSETLLHDLKRAQEALRRRVAADCSHQGIHHLLLTSDADVFNLGGDLALFSQLIRSGNRGRLLEYARLCIEVAYNFYRPCDDRVHSIAVVQGDALGGGFEAALCCHTIIIEEHAGMGFPEVLFDLFPGMGAYTFLTRRVPALVAERMMLDGRVYDAAELLRLGIVDMVVPKGEGLLAAQALVRRRQRIGNALRSMNTVRQACLPVTLDELYSVTAEWVDAAMRLDQRGLRTMERLVRAQQRRAGTEAETVERSQIA